MHQPLSQTMASLSASGSYQAHYAVKTDADAKIKFAEKGCCPEHPSIQLRVPGGMFGKTKVLHSVCPECEKNQDIERRLKMAQLAPEPEKEHPAVIKPEITAFFDELELEVTPELVAVFKELGLNRVSNFLDLDKDDVTSLQRCMPKIPGKKFVKKVEDLKVRRGGDR